MKLDECAVMRAIGGIWLWRSCESGIWGMRSALLREESARRLEIRRLDFITVLNAYIAQRLERLLRLPACRMHPGECEQRAQFERA